MMSQKNDAVYSDQYLTVLLQKAEVFVRHFKFKNKRKKNNGQKQEK